MSLVTASEALEAVESLLPPMSGVSLDGVLEWPTEPELGVREEPDCLESRPPAAVSSCPPILKEGIGGLRVMLDSVCTSAA